MRPLAAPVVFLPLLALVGCANATRYEIVAPPDARGPVPREVGTSFTKDRVEYEVYQVEDKVIVRFVNRTTGPLTLTDASTMTDGRGKAFAVDAQSVGPDQSGRLVVPPGPTAAEAERRRPIAGEVHVGGVDEGGLIRRRDENVARPEPTTSGLFAWPAGQTARLRLRFDADGTPLTHEWILRRA